MSRKAAVRMVLVWLVGVLMGSSASAGIFSGTLTSVSSSRVAIQATSSKKIRSFRISRRVKVTLDRKPSRASSLKIGDRVSVFENNGVVRKITARRATAKKSVKTDSSTKSPSKSTSGKSTPATPTRRPGGSSGNQMATSWNQFRGPMRDNISRETGLLDSWPQKGPRLLWTARGLGEGYSSVSLADGKVYTMGLQGGREVIFALDIASGRELWTANTGGGRFSNGMGNGPRGTPAVDSGLIFALGGSGDLICVDAKSGARRWQKNILREFDGRNIGWGISESPLVDGNMVIVTPGGRAATMAALDKTDGTVIWRSQVPGDHSAGYSSPIVATVNGVRQYINFTNKAVIGVDANSGRPLWSDNSSSNNTANCSSPLFYQNHVFSSSGYNKGGAMLFLQSRNGKTTSRFVYETDKMKNHHGGMVVVDGYIYGSSDPGILTCLELRSGRVAWQTRDAGKGSVTYADGHLYVRAENGPMYLIEATPQGHEVKGRFNLPQRSGKKAWSHPVVAEGKLFLRDQDMLFCYDIKN